MKKVFFTITAVLMALSLCGCAAVLIGGGVAGGIAISKDSAKVEKDVSFDRAWSVTYKTLDEMGVINLEDKKAGKIEANVQDSKVVAQVSRITERATKIEIKARKNLFPNVDLAVEILNRINDRL